MRLPSGSLRAAATVKKTAELRTLCITKHFTEWHTGAQLRSRPGVEPVCDESRSDAITQNVKDEQVRVAVIVQRDESEVVSNRSRGVKIRFHGLAATGKPLRRKALLDAGREQKALFDLSLLFFELGVGLARLFLGALLT